MNLNITIYSILSGITLLLSLYFGINSILKIKRKKSSYSFAILSATVFLISLGNMVMITSANINLIKSFAHLMNIAVYIFPASLFHYTVDRLDYNFFKKDIVKYLFYIPSIAIVLFLSFTGGVTIEKVDYGYTINTELAMMFGVFYMAPLLFLIIAYISYDLYRTQKTNYPTLRIVVLLSGVVFFTVATIIMRPIEAIYSFGIAYNSIFMFILFILIATSDYMERITIDSLTFSKMFETIDDCIMITDRKGQILKLNLKMVKILFGDSEKIGSLNSNEIKSRMLSAADPRKKLENLFEYFKDDSAKKVNLDIGCMINNGKKYFNITSAPIVNEKEKLLGKITIFRDVTEKKTLQDRLRDESIKDFLTDAYNRRYFYELLENAIKRFNRYRKPFSLLMIDVDNFKKLNDKYGHLKGDWLLQELAKIIKENIRSGIDNIIRFGGDEFVVLLEDSGIERAEVVSNRIIRKFNTIDKKESSLSIGISRYQKGMTQDELIKNADAVMYEAKMEKGSAIKSIEKI